MSAPNPHPSLPGKKLRGRRRLACLPICICLLDLPWYIKMNLSGRDKFPTESRGFAGFLSWTVVPCTPFFLRVWVKVNRICSCSWLLVKSLKSNSHRRIFIEALSRRMINKKKVTNNESMKDDAQLDQASITLRRFTYTCVLMTKLYRL